MSLRDLTIYHFIQHNADYAGEAPAVISGNTVVSHRDFLSQVDRLAAGFSAQRLVKGDRVCILAQNSVDYLALYGACAKTGLIAYPINWRLTANEVKHVIALAEPKMLAVEARHMSQLEHSDLSNIPVRVLIGADKDAAGGTRGYTSLTEFYRTPADNAATDVNGDDPDVSGDDPFVIISTAAVAGMPRGALLTHNNLIFAGYQFITTLGLTSQDRYLSALPLFHITGLQRSLEMTQTGGTNVIMERFDSAAASNAIDTHQVTLLAVFPPILSMLMAARTETGASWDTLKYVVGLDAPDTIMQLQQETQAKFWTGFGQSETTGMVTATRVDQRPGASGRPVAMAQVRCVDEAGEDVPVGQPGEIVVRGPLVFAGYWRDSDATNYALRHGWHHTGDIGKFDEDGYLYYVGRKPEKELIKPGGENVYPAEVEQVIETMPAVSAVCVIGVPDAKWGEAVKAVVELSDGQTLTAEQVADWVGERIARYKRPRHVDFVAALPRKSDGEIDRVAIKAAHGQAQA